MALSSKEKRDKRDTAFRKLNNQLSVLSRTAPKKDAAAIAEMQERAGTLSFVK